MALNIIKNNLTRNRCYQKNEKRKPIGIQLHTIGTGQGTAQAVADYWNQPGISACVTYIVDCDTEGKVLQCLPEEVRSWADAGYGNDHLITFEICESDAIRYTGGADYVILNQEQFRTDLLRGYRTAVLLCADICRRYRWDPMTKLPSGLYRISSHDEGRRAGLSSAHVDPTHVWDRFGWTMDQFRAEVKAVMADTAETETEAERLSQIQKQQEKQGIQQYVVQAGSFISKANAEKLFRKIKKSGFDAFVKKQDDQWKVQCGVFRERKNAELLAQKLKAAGFAATVKQHTEDLLFKDKLIKP